MLKRLAHLLFGDYGLYRIYACITTAVQPPERDRAVRCAPLDSITPLLHTPWESLRGLAAYAGEGAWLYGAWLGAELAAVACYWNPKRYASRGFLTLMPDEAKLVQLTTAEPYRGRGLATHLVRYSASDLRHHGPRRLLARIWHNHHASCRALEQAGWVQIARIVELHPLGMRPALRLRWRVDPMTHADPHVRPESPLPPSSEPRPRRRAPGPG